MGEAKMLKMLKSLLVVAVLAGSSLVSGCASSTNGLAAIPAGDLSVLRLEPGDRIKVQIPDLQGADAEYAVDQTGVIALPLVEEVKISGLTLREAEKAIEKALLDKRILVRPNVTLQAASLRPIYILGEIGKPGQYEFREGLTVFSIISLAGGYTYRADTTSMVITRTVNGRKVTGRASENTVVMPGDQIRIVEKWF
ncbi:polysaccharide export protein [Sphingorhabdus lacus]|jgi:protein involved in polysaccharide export with SLBB domain|uniref:Polysaccharide export protein n=2 Tax=Sphingorhabdus lacus TaxID=392610 RepID=A0A6I6LGR5_9SPHN|nr:polysaccharide export protein [Sphingorhabdus lacus]